MKPRIYSIAPHAAAIPVTAEPTTVTGAVSGALSTLSAVSDTTLTTAVAAAAVADATLPAVVGAVDGPAAGGLEDVFTFFLFFNRPWEFFQHVIQ